MKRLDTVKEELAKRIRLKVEMEYPPSGKAGDLSGWRKAAQDCGISTNQLWRLGHPNAKTRAGKPYLGDPFLGSVLTACEWVGCTLGALEPATGEVALADVLDAIRRLAIGTEQQKNIASALLRTYCANTGLGIETQITGSLEDVA